MKIVVLDGSFVNPGDLSWESLRRLGDLKVYEWTAAEELYQRIGDAEAVILQNTPLGREVFEACPGIRYIGIMGSESDIVDVKAAAKKGITVCNVPDFCNMAMAQMTFALLLETCHHIQRHSQAVKKGEWESDSKTGFGGEPLMELCGKSMGIIGGGHVSREVAGIASAFGMKVYVYDPAGADCRISGVSEATLDELLEKSDVISLHCPLTAETEGIINRESIGKMKRGVILINTGRGPLVEEEDLADALKEERVYAAACDSASTEPVSPENPLLGCDNCIMTPRMAGGAKESRQRLLEETSRCLAGFISGKPENEVTASS